MTQTTLGPIRGFPKIGGVPYLGVLIIRILVFRGFPKIGGVPYLGVLIIRILVFRILFSGPLFSETPIRVLGNTISVPL